MWMYCLSNESVGSHTHCSYYVHEGIFLLYFDKVLQSPLHPSDTPDIHINNIHIVKLETWTFTLISLWTSSWILRLQPFQKIFLFLGKTPVPMAYHLHPHPNEMMTSNLRSPSHETNGFWLLCIFLYGPLSLQHHRPREASSQFWETLQWPYLALKDMRSMKRLSKPNPFLS